MHGGLRRGWGAGGVGGGLLVVVGAARMWLGWKGVSRGQSEQTGGGRFRSNLVCLRRTLDLIPRAAGATEGLGAGEW